MIEVAGATVRYAADGDEALSGVDLAVSPGEVVALVGTNGSGKSTLGALLCAMRAADAGRVLVDGYDPAAGPAERLEVRRRVGLVRQHPNDQLVSTVVFDEVAFGPKNLGLPVDEVRRRVEEALASVGLSDQIGAGTEALSGGQQQLLAIAGVLAMEPAYLVLDEATSMLDSSARPAFRELVRKLADERGVGVIQITHDPLEILESDRAVVLDAGRKVFDGAPARLLVEHQGLWDTTIVESPSVELLRGALKLGFDGVPACTPQAACAWLEGRLSASEMDSRDADRLLDRLMPTGAGPEGAESPARDAETQASRSGTGRVELALDGVSFGYGTGESAVSDVSLRVDPGEVVLLAGRSGSGKSTLACLAAGLYEADEGSVKLGDHAPRPGEVGMAFQRPEDQLFCDTVRDELAFAPRNLGCTEDGCARRVERASKLVGLPDELMERYPFDLSGGQARRVAIASILSLDAAVYVLDEPTAGLDAGGRAALHRLARTCAEEGCGVMIISHDLEEWLGEVDRVVLMAGGRMVWQGSPRDMARDREAFSSADMRAPFCLELAWRIEDALGGARR